MTNIPIPAISTPTVPHTARDGRTLHLVDIQNLVAGRPSSANLQAAWQGYHRQIGVAPHDQLRLACAASLAARVAFTIPAGRQLLIGHNGPNAADLALLESVDVDFTAQRFAHVVIASGDHAFAPLAAELAHAGCRVHAATHRRAGCSAALRLASHTHIALDYRLNRP